MFKVKLAVLVAFSIISLASTNVLASGYAYAGNSANGCLIFQQKPRVDYGSTFSSIVKVECRYGPESFDIAKATYYNSFQQSQNAGYGYREKYTDRHTRNIEATGPDDITTFITACALNNNSFNYFRVMTRVEVTLKSGKRIVDRRWHTAPRARALLKCTFF